MTEINTRKTGVMNNMKMLYMYDVRGIQDYIFRTNKMKEIIGASLIVDELIINLFKKATEDYNVSYDMKANDELKFKFDDSNELDAEILYYGGGNLLVLFNNKEIAEKVSKEMCFKLVKKTYTLQLAVAGVEATGDYHKDYLNLRKEMDRVKLNMPMSLPVSGFPITLNDPQSGFAFSKEFDGKKCTYEAYKKLKAFDKKYSNNEIEKINDFKSFEGESLIAIVHIDGNNMGQRIANIMGKITDYKEAAKSSRKISEDINDWFINKALKNVENKVEDFCLKVGLKKTKGEAFRKIISAGDDITFVCNARIAMACVEEFMKSLGDDYTACAGVYVTHTHFPFSRAYEYAEQLCSNAKKLSRDNPGNYVDFHINYGGILNDLDTIRETQYSVAGKSLVARPYNLNDNINDLFGMLSEFKKRDIARTQLKGLRESFMEGPEVVGKELARINSRLKEELKINEEEYGLLFDAIEVMDLKWGECHE